MARKKKPQKSLLNEELEELEEKLSSLGIELVDDSPNALKETLYKRVMKRIVTEKQKRKQAQTVDRLVDNIFERIQKTSTRRPPRRRKK
jgi:hypothetical protein